MAPTQTRLLTLHKGKKNVSILYRLEKGWVLRFVLGPTLMGHKVRLFTNHPLSDPETWQNLKGDRSSFAEVPWMAGSKNKNDELDQFADIKLWMAGPFHYYILLDDNTDIEKCDGSGYFQVTPTLTVGAESHPLPLDSIQCQTVLAKLLGPFPEWESRLKVSKQSGYNMVHLTPTQELGSSNSSYSLADQHQLNSAFNVNGQGFTYDDVKNLTTKMRNEWQVLTVTDVVWNHTSKDSPWLKTHPECGYNLQNSPHLRPAFLLDRALHYFGKSVAENHWEHRGLPAMISEDHHLHVLKSILLEEVLPPIKLHEFFQVDVDGLTKEFAHKLEDGNGNGNGNGNGGDNGNHNDRNRLEYSDVCLSIITDPEYKRFGSRVDMGLAMTIFNSNKTNEMDRKRHSINEFRQKLVELNNQAAGRCWDDLCKAVDAIIGHVRYERVDFHGPRLRVYNETNPLVTSYFKYDGPNYDLSADEALMYNKNNVNVMAFNGWVMNDDPLNNFAEPHSMVYFRRELICWGDCVKLRYGNKPEDCPFLWEYMAQYSRKTAEVFYGIRLDNCHSTPIHVAQYLLDEARRTRPELYVMAELFTGSEDIDNIFVNRLGITSLVRESMSAGDSHELGRLVYRYGGSPVGSFIQRPTRPITPSIAHAVFLDLSHDNQCPVQVRTVYDLFPSAALVSMACCATGSNRGYDELVTHHINVVNEKRLYGTWSDEEKLDVGHVNQNSGIVSGKRLLNDLHFELGMNEYTEVFVDQLNEDTVAVTRHNPSTHRSVVLVARTCFRPDKLNASRHIVLRIPGVVEQIIFEAKVVMEPKNPQTPPKDNCRPKPNKSWPGADKYIVGTPDYHMEIREGLQLFNSEMVELVHSDDFTSELEFSNLPAGAVVAFRVSMHHHSQQAILTLRNFLTQFGFRPRSLSGTLLKSPSSGNIEKTSNLRAIADQLSLQDMNIALFRCHEEEASEGFGGGAYNLPKVGSFVYCGFQAVIVLMTEIREKNDLGHPLCDNLRQGNWLIEYYARRLTQYPGTKELGNWFSELLVSYAMVPHYLRPCYFDAITSGIYKVLREAAWRKMATFVHEGSYFVRSLALSTLAFCSYSKDARLPEISSNIRPPLPPTRIESSTGQRQQACTTLSAGLPHFSCGLFRNWGRDTFIAMPGVLLVPGRFDEARYIILAYAGCLRHGLIPNLLGGGAFARYNCRDAVWWWLHAIKCFTEMAPEGMLILDDKVRRLYPQDDSEPGKDEKEESLHETMQEALHRHFQGISFRERNAGSAIDMHMKDEGFNVTAGVDVETGFVYGGNEWNCGTWMDKMGSSDRAGNRGKPATPRDGSAIELVGLCASVVGWLATMHENGKYPHGGVNRIDENDQSVFWTWKEWADRTKANFERFYWIDSVNGTPNESKYVNVHGIYKDTLKATQRWTDYQLRPNFAIAMTVAPELFNEEHAWTCLNIAEERLKGPLGMRTLDPKDWVYDGFYNNDDDSHDARRAKGFNYHQGPEWLWVTGYFLRAQLTMAYRLRKQRNDVWPSTIAHVQQALSAHWEHLLSTPWRSLPELTNKDGIFCAGSCPAQAWSVGCILEVTRDLNQYANAGLCD